MYNERKCAENYNKWHNIFFLNCNHCVICYNFWHTFVPYTTVFGASGFGLLITSERSRRCFNRSTARRPSAVVASSFRAPWAPGLSAEDAIFMHKTNRSSLAGKIPECATNQRAWSNNCLPVVFVPMEKSSTELNVVTFTSTYKNGSA